MDENLKISVVTVCFNAVGSIEETMLSVLNQTYTKIEYIIIDGGSTDGTVDVIKKYADRLAYWVSEPDKGIYDAMNKGIAAATGDYINFMNAGDTFVSPDTIKSLVSKIDISYDIVYGDTIHVAKWGEYLSKAVNLDNFRSQMPFGHQSTFVKLPLMKKKRFDTSFRCCGDYHFLYNCYHDDKRFLYIPITVSRYDLIHGMSLDNYRIKYKENGRIWGCENNIRWKIKCRLMILNRDLRVFVKRMAPNCLIRKIRKF